MFVTPKKCTEVLQAATSFRGVRCGHVHLLGHVNVYIFQNDERKNLDAYFSRTCSVDRCLTKCYHGFWSTPPYVVAGGGDSWFSREFFPTFRPASWWNLPMLCSLCMHGVLAWGVKPCPGSLQFSGLYYWHNTRLVNSFRIHNTQQIIVSLVPTY
jgi:hypothetical protein